MAVIDIGAVIKGITERKLVYSDGAQQQTLFIRDVALENVGMPPQVLPVPTFTLAVTDATQWAALQVGATVTVRIDTGA